MNNPEITKDHAAFLQKAITSNSISKVFVMFDEFKKNPDKYILLTEYLAKNE